MATCKDTPLSPGYKCLDCWGCVWPAGSNRGRCLRQKLVGPSKSITTCEAASTQGRPLFSTQEKCVENCGGEAPGVACYRCEIKPGEKKGTCVKYHPIDPHGDPYKVCPKGDNIFPTLQECQAKCVESGPVKPVAHCWSGTPPGCDCQFGEARGPDGPLESCESGLGFYDTKGECQRECGKKPRDDKTLWIVLGVVGGVLLLLIIIGIVVYVAWKKKHRPPEPMMYY